MATWKKVIVSGSDISQLNNDANYLIDAQSGAILTGSFTGSFTGDGSGLTGVQADTLPNSLTDGNGIADFTFNGSADASVTVEADGSTLSVSADGVKVADAGITATQLATSVAGEGLAGGGGTALSVNVDDSTIEISSDSLQVKDLGIDTDQLADDAVTNAKIADDSITVAQLSGSAVVTEAEGITSNDVDTAVPTAAAVKDYVDTQVGGSTLDGSTDSGAFSVDLDDDTFGINGKASRGIAVSGSGTDVTIEISDGGVTNDMLAGSIANAKLSNSEITLGTTTVALGATESTLAGVTLSGPTIQDANATGSFTGSFVGDGSGLTGVTAQVEESLLLGNGLNGGTFTGQTGVTASINLDGGTLSVGASGLKVADGGIDTLQLATGSVTNAKLENDSFNITDGSASETVALGGTLDIRGTANEVDVVLSGGTYTVGMPDDVTISGDLTVLGTASFAEETNLAIADRFILLASGSTSTGDGGIVVQQTTQDVGEVFAFEDNDERWGVATDFNASGNSVTFDAFMAAALSGTQNSHAAISASHDDRYNAAGNIFTSTTDESIWIYS